MKKSTLLIGHKSTSYRHAVLLLATLGQIVANGCYTYRGGAIPEIDPQSISAPANDTSIAYELRAESNVGDDAEIRDIARKSLLTAMGNAGVEIKEVGTVSETDLTLSVDVKVKGSKLAQAVSGFVSGFTWAVFPAFAQNKFVIEANVLDRDGSTKTFQYNDTMNIVIQILLLPFTNSSTRVVEEMIADMMRSLVRDMQQDSLLPAPEQAAHPPNSGATCFESMYSSMCTNLPLRTVATKQV